MQVLITGGSGLIGRALSTNLVQLGNVVIILSRKPEQVNDLPNQVLIKRWDGCTTNGWGHLVNNSDVVINLAGENISSGRWTKKRKNRIINSRLNAGKAIVEAIKAANNKPRVFIQASAVGYYGDSGNIEITEESSAGHGNLVETTRLWEESTESLDTLGVRRVIIRTGVVLSNKGGVLIRLLPIFRFYLGGQIGSGKQWFPWIHIFDEVTAICSLIENDTARGPFNLVAPSPLTNSKFSHLLGQQLQRPSWISIPTFALHLIFGEMATVLLESQRVVPQRLQEIGFKFRFPEVTLALKDLLD